MSILKDELNNEKYSGLSDSDAAALINVKDIPSKQAISVSDIKKYLTLASKRVAITESSEVAAKATVLAFSDFESFDMADPLNELALTTQMDGLVVAALISPTDRTKILAMGDTAISRATELELGIVTAGQIQAERN